MTTLQRLQAALAGMTNLDELRHVAAIAADYAGPDVAAAVLVEVERLALAESLRKRIRAARKRQRRSLKRDAARAAERHGEQAAALEAELAEVERAAAPIGP